MKKGPDHSGPFLLTRKNWSRLDKDYLATRLHGIGWKPLNEKSAPAAIGWLDVTLTVNETFVTGPPVVGRVNGMSLVCPAARVTVLAPASPG
jgi:hypothetical protein